MKNLICRLLHVKDDEFGKLVTAFLVLFLVLSGIILGRNARDSIFLVNVGIQYLPYMYIVNAVFVVICSFIYSFFVDRMDRTAFVVRTSLLFLSLTLICKLALLVPVPAVVIVASIVCYVSVQVIWLISLMMFWTLAGDYFDTRQSKRLFPLIGAGGLVGMIAAGLGSRYVVKAVGGTDNLFLVWAVLILLSVLLVMRMKKKYGQPEAKKPSPGAQKEAAKSQAAEMQESFDYLKESKLLKNMVGITLFLWLVFTIVDYEFSLVMKARYPSKDDLTAALGVFRGLAGFVSLLVQFFVTQKLVAKIGVARAVLIHPLFLGVSSLLMSVKYGFWTVSAAKFGDHVLLYTVQDSSYQMLYNPIPPEKRGRARALVEGYIKPFAMGIAGLVMVVSAAFLTPDKISILAFVLALAWIGFSVFTRGGYVDALVKNLEKIENSGKTQALQELHKLSGAENLKVLREVLQADNPNSVKYALETVEYLGQADFSDEILEWSASWGEENRAIAVRVLGSFKKQDLKASFIRMLEDPSVLVRLEALKSLALIATDEDLPHFAALTASPEMDVRREAMVAAVQVGGLDGIITVLEKMKELVRSTEEADKVTVCGIIASVRIKYFIPDLLKYLEDPSLPVRKAAVRALSKIRDERAFDVMVHLLDDRRFMRTAMKGLLDYNEKYNGLFYKELRDNPSSLVRMNLVRVMDRSGTHDVYHELLPFISDPDPSVRGEILRVLIRRFRRERTREDFREVLNRHIALELEHVYRNTWGLILFRKRHPGPEGDMLETSLREENDRMLKNLFHSLGMLTEPSVMLQIYRDLTRGDAKKQALAYETLENVGLPDINAKLSPLFDDRTPEEKESMFRRGTSLDDFYNSLLNGKSDWLQAVALYTIGLVKERSFIDTVRGFIGNPHPLLAENAAFAAARLNVEKE